MIQDFALIDQYTVYQNVVISLKYSIRPVSDKRKLVQNVLSEMGLEDKMQAYASNLSGGQKQRAAIARAIIWCLAPTRN